MQRLNLLAALLTFVYGTWQSWPLINSLEKALLAYVIVFGAQILVLMGLLYVARAGTRRGGEQ